MLARCLNAPRRLHLSQLYSRSYSRRENSPNAGIVDFLTRAQKEEDTSSERNAYKVRSFNLAIAAISQLDKPLLSGQEAMKLRGIGRGIAERIDLYLQGTDFSSRHEEAALHNSRLITMLQSVQGLGPHTAAKLVDAGVQSLADLSKPKYFKLMTSSQRIGLVYAEHLAQPVTREEAETVVDFIRDHISSRFSVELMGSYRRGASSMSDIDVLLTHPSVVHVPTPSRLPSHPRPNGRRLIPFNENVTESERMANPSSHVFPLDVIRPLEDAGLLAATFSFSAKQWQGVVLLPPRLPKSTGWDSVGERISAIRTCKGTFRRLELTLAPIKSHGAAKLALTGDVEFVRSARLAAIKQGLHLNEYGLWRWNPADPSDTSPPTPKSAGYWELLESEDEDAILEALNMGPVSPERRNFSFLLRKLPKRLRPPVFLPKDAAQAMQANMVDEGLVYSGRGRPRTRVPKSDADKRARGRPRNPERPDLPKRPVGRPRKTEMPPDGANV
ncbi:hypothetical protein OF83DRAFT_692087 [Amylostereum chailletii]|nr:hypothetical protein OF83DRAFT_692087 [Amylostereum chailletii]